MRGDLNLIFEPERREISPAAVSTSNVARHLLKVAKEEKCKKNTKAEQSRVLFFQALVLSREYFNNSQFLSRTPCN